MSPPKSETKIDGTYNHPFPSIWNPHLTKWYLKWLRTSGIDQSLVSSACWWYCWILTDHVKAYSEEIVEQRFGVLFSARAVNQYRLNWMSATPEQSRWRMVSQKQQKVHSRWSEVAYIVYWSIRQWTSDIVLFVEIIVGYLPQREIVKVKFYEQHISAHLYLIPNFQRAENSMQNGSGKCLNVTALMHKYMH